MNAVARNAPCPCGSGKRYKDCHGALSAAPAKASDDSWVRAALREALEAQREGLVVEAAEKYRRVLAAQPDNFDANHMLSLVEYEIGHYEQAVALMHKAIELRPELGVPRLNLRVLESLPTMEVEICREALARLVNRVDTEFSVNRLAESHAVHVVGRFGEAERAALPRVIGACGPSTVTLWRESAGDSEAALATIPLTTSEHPRGGWLVLLGAEAPLAAWLPAARADGAVVVATRDEPCLIVDRVDELAAAGDARPGLLCATPALARRLGLPQTAVLHSPSAAMLSRRDAA
jgi:tetratricopeptide (TPR) repeat protein